MLAQNNSFERLRARLLADLKSLPRYTCVQTITRAYRKPSRKPARIVLPCAQLVTMAQRKAPYTAWDRLRVDVTMADGREIYAWAGTPRFQGSIFDVVGRMGRVIADGDFGGFLSGILEDSGRIESPSERVVDGHKLLEVRYDVPDFRSRYLVRVGTRSPFKVAYKGSLLFDPQTNDIISAASHTAEFPAESGQCSADELASYGRLSINDSQALIPKSVHTTLLDREGGESVIDSTYSNCRVYAGGSQIVLDTPEDAAQKAEVLRLAQNEDAAPSVIPGLKRFTALIVTPIDSDIAAAGDAIEAVLQTSIREAGRVIAPIGSRIHGRLALVLKMQSPEFVEIGVRLESIEANGARITLHASQRSPTTPLRRFNRQTYGFLDHISDEVGLFVFPVGRVQTREIPSHWTTNVAEPLYSVSIRVPSKPSMSTESAKKAPPVASLPPVDVSGEWQAVGVHYAPWTFVFRTNGSKLTGTVRQADYDPISEIGTNLSNAVKIYDGVISADRIYFKCDSPDRPEQRTVTFAGHIDGDKIVFIRSVKVFRGGSSGLDGIYGEQGAGVFTATRTKRAK